MGKVCLMWFQLSSGSVHSCHCCKRSAAQHSSACGQSCNWRRVALRKANVEMGHSETVSIAFDTMKHFQSYN
eukprot:6239926-Amphidinium_carterae.1